MSDNILNFPNRRPIENGLTYIVPASEGGPNWLLYRQEAGADEPELVQVFTSLPRALVEGRELARGHRDRFMIDEGVLS